MALSDYLTEEEWDACFYQAVIGPLGKDNLGDTMRAVIQHLLSKGYRFSGLDENGAKLKQIEGTSNSKKIVMFVIGPQEAGIDPLRLLDNGRNFWKTHDPTLVAETDYEWEQEMKQAQTPDPAPTE